MTSLSRNGRISIISMQPCIMNNEGKMKTKLFTLLLLSLTLVGCIVAPAPGYYGGGPGYYGGAHGGFYGEHAYGYR
jgi:hypothetical protein